MEKNPKQAPKPEPGSTDEKVNWIVVGPLVAILAASILYVTLFL